VLQTLTLDSFTRHLNTTFQVERASIPARLVLVQAAKVHAMRGWEAFSLVFRGPADAFLPQATYRLRHAALGDFDLFFTPIRQDQLGFYYEAVFNRRAEGRE